PRARGVAGERPPYAVPFKAGPRRGADRIGGYLYHALAVALDGVLDVDVEQVPGVIVLRQDRGREHHALGLDVEEGEAVAGHVRGRGAVLLDLLDRGA